jgi:hypothetical protein
MPTPDQLFGAKLAEGRLMPAGTRVSVEGLSWESTPVPPRSAAERHLDGGVEHGERCLGLRPGRHWHAAPAR